MPMKTLFLADPINEFIKNHDSTWALMQAAFGLGHKVFYANAASLGINQNQAICLCIELDEDFFADQGKNPSTLVLLDKAYKETGANLDDFNLVFMRKDPPVDNAYLHQCQILSLCKKAKLINNPLSLINFNEKLSIMNFPELIAPTIISSSKKEIKDFLQIHKKIVIKPIDRKGGEGIFVIEENDRNLDSIIETLSEIHHHKYPNILMIQKYIPEIKTEGDKRIIIFNGKPVAGLLRIPAPGDNRANIAAGGSFAKYALTKRDLEISSKIEGFLVKNQIYFAGIDVIGDYLTEINITSPTCLQEINQLEGFTGKDKIEYKLFEDL